VFVCTQSAGAARDPAAMLAGVALRKALSTFAGLALLTGGATTATTRIAFGSCNFADAPQPFWPILASRKPDLFIWGGDNVYADQKTIVDRRSAASLAPGERTRFSARNKSEHEAMYERQKQVPSYAAFAKAVPIVGTWDDHDCGINDADRHFAHKHERQALHLDFLGVPREHPRRARLGVYNAHVVDHGPGRRVKVILLDTRFHRDAWPWHPGESTPEASDVLGEEQWSWLERELSAPTTPTDTSDASVATDSDLAVDLHLVVSGIQVLPLVAAAHEHHESWVHFPTSRRRLFSLLARAAAPALLLSGDVHFAELSEAACFGGAGAHSTDATASPTEERTHVERTHVERYARVGRLLEFTSSGLTHAWSEGWSWPRPWPLPLLFRLGWWLWSLVGVHPWRLAAYPGLNVGEVLVTRESGDESPPYHPPHLTLLPLARCNTAPTLPGIATPALCLAPSRLPCPLVLLALGAWLLTLNSHSHRCTTRPRRSS